MKKILLFISTLILFLNVSVVSADELVSFNFMDKGNSAFVINANNSISGTFNVSVEDMTQTKPYINLLIAMTGYPEFTITENDYFSNTVVKKLYSAGTTNINGYTADLYVIQFATRGTGWNCSVSGLNCYVSTTLKLENIYGYNAMYQLQSIALSDSVLTDDYLANMQINQNNQIIEQGKETNEKLDNLDDTIKDTNQQLQDSITESNNETQEVIKDQFNSCRDSYNLLYIPDSTIGNNGLTAVSKDNIINISGTRNGSVYLTYSINLSLMPGIYTLSMNANYNYPYLWLRKDGKNVITSAFADRGEITFTLSEETSFDSLVLYINSDTFAPELKIMLNEGSSALSFEKTGEICSNKIDDTNDKLDSVNGSINDLNNSLTNSNSSDATNSAGNFFSGFETDTFGLTSIITAPLDLIGSITSSSCTPLPLTVPFVDTSFSLPCMSTIYEEHFGSFLNIYQTITFGIVAYWVCVRIFALVKDFKNPDHDEIEVLDL